MVAWNLTSMVVPARRASSVSVIVFPPIPEVPSVMSAAVSSCSRPVPAGSIGLTTVSAPDVALFESRLHPRGASYEALSRVTLR